MAESQKKAEENETERIPIDPDNARCEMPECSNTENLKLCSDPENNLLEMCPECRSAWPVEVVSDPIRTDGGAVQGKEANDDWTGTMSTWGDGFEIEIKAEGNEAEGEGPLVTADMTAADYLARETDLEGGERAAEHELTTARAWETENVRYTVMMHGDAAKVEEYAEAIFEAVRPALPDDCVQVKA